MYKLMPTKWDGTLNVGGAQYYDLHMKNAIHVDFASFEEHDAKPQKKEEKKPEAVKLPTAPKTERKPAVAKVYRRTEMPVKQTTKKVQVSNDGCNLGDWVKNNLVLLLIILLILGVVVFSRM